jgi:PAS domain S-box-containing protein
MSGLVGGPGAQSSRERVEISRGADFSDLDGWDSADHLPQLEALREHHIELELQNDQLRAVARELESQNDQLRSVERELEQSRARYWELFELAPVGYVSLDVGGMIDRANRAAELLLGVAHGGLVRRSLAEFTEGRDLRTLRAHLRAAAHDRQACEVRLRGHDGRTADALVDSRPAPAGGCLVVLTDISERKRAERALSQAKQKLLERTAELASEHDALEDARRGRAASDAERGKLALRLRHAERLESLGLLAGGVAHDFNNILVGVMANADLLLETMPDLAPAVQDGLATIRQAACSAADLTRQLLVYAGRGFVTLEPVSLHRVIAESIGLLRARAPANVELCAELGAQEHWIHADAGQVQQVIGNLVTNALEAVGEHAGRVIVRTRVEPLDAEALAHFSHVNRAEPGRFVVLEVEDTGVGIDAAHLSRIFEPFFTSKFTGRGLGLASVLGIAHSHRAALHVRSVPGQGSIFEIAWPLVAPGVVSKASTPSPQSKPWKGSGPVLLVDDDPLVRRALGRQLEQLGFMVTQAASGVEALEFFRATPSRFRLAVIDRTMPGLSGDSLLELLHQIDPALRALLVSGYSAGGPVAADDRVAFKAKPMTLCDLRLAVAKLLDNPLLDNPLLDNPQLDAQQIGGPRAPQLGTQQPYTQQPYTQQKRP